VVTLAGATLAMLVSTRDRPGLQFGEAVGPLRLPGAVLVGCVLMGAYVSPFPEVTIPKLSGIVLGMLVLRAIVLTGTTRRRVWLLTWAYLIVGACVALVGLIVTPAGDKNYAVVLWVGSKIPHLIRGLPGAEAGVNPNALGGSVLLFLPCASVLALYCATHHPSHVRGGVQRALLAVAVVALCACALLLSESKTAWISAALTAFVVASARHRAAAVVCGAATIALVGWVWFSPGYDISVVGRGRTSIWAFAIENVQAHPITGVGLGAFRQIATGASLSGAPVVAHAHNVYVQVALDLGIPGLVAYLTLLGLTTTMALEVLHGSGAAEQALALGLWASVFAVHVFGISDAIAPGAKVGVALWWSVGLIAALFRIERSASQCDGPQDRERMW
jgi:putative inorganic carbon (HCO3(-)) transporter